MDYRDEWLRFCAGIHFTPIISLLVLGGGQVKHLWCSYFVQNIFNRCMTLESSFNKFETPAELSLFSLCWQHTDRQTDCFTPCAWARGNKYVWSTGAICDASVASANDTEDIVFVLLDDSDRLVHVTSRSGQGRTIVSSLPGNPPW